MKRRFVQINGELVEVGLDYVPEPRADHHVIPDIVPFKSTDGAVITGRAHWREHLKANNLQEFGHSDIKYQGAQWEKKKQAQQERIQRGGGPTDVTTRLPEVFEPAAPSRLHVELANRLHGRPRPERKEFIKLALEQSKRMSRGR